MDYIVGAWLIAMPWVLGFNNNGAATWVPVINGIAAFIYSLLTDYEMGIARAISMRTHLTIDLLSGIVLAASPWIFGFANDVFVAHLVMGIFEIGASLMTKTKPRYGNRAVNSHGAFSIH